MADAALAAGAQLVVNDIATMMMAIRNGGSIDVAPGKVHAITTAQLHVFTSVLLTDSAALQVLINADPSVP
jgi:hypothetical protein